MDQFAKFYNKALKFLSYRPRSEKEIRDNLKGKRYKKHGTSGTEINDSVIEQIINKLKEQKFLNDEEFAKWWIESRLNYKPRALRLIKIELKQKGISDDIIESLIHDSESLIHNDLEMAKRLAEKKIKRYKDLPKQEIYQKLGRFLSSKGFSWDTIKKAIEESS